MTQISTDSIKGNSSTLTTGNARDRHISDQRKVSWGLNDHQFLVVGMFCPTDGKLEPLGRALVKHAANPSQNRGQPKMPWTPRNQEWGKPVHSSRADFLHTVPHLSNQWIWRLILPKEALCCCENAQVCAQESKCLGKLPNHCKGSFRDQYHQVSGLREKYLLVDISAPLRRIIYDASPSRLQHSGVVWKQDIQIWGKKVFSPETELQGNVSCFLSIYKHSLFPGSHWFEARYETRLVGALSSMV